MRILLISSVYNNGGTGEVVFNLYTQLKNNGIECAVAYGRGSVIKEFNIYKFSSYIETYAHAFLTRLTGLTGIYSPVATRKLINFMDEFKPDIVHIHELHAYFANITPVMNYLKKKNIKTIWTFHCEFMYTGKCGHSDDCEKWKSECGRCPKVKKYPSSLYFDFTKKMFNDKKCLFDDFNNLTIVTPSQWLANRVRESFLKEKSIVVIHNGVDTENVFYPRPFEHLQRRHNITDEKIVLAVAPHLMSGGKGGQWVLGLAKRFKGENVKFILIGVDDLRQNFDDNVIALGRTFKRIELSEYYSMADVFLFCSRKETFSVTCAEALCCGTPVVGFKAGAPETIFAEPYAHFTDYGDTDSLKNVLLKRLNSAPNSKEISDYGRQHFDKKRMFEQYLSLYQNQVGGNEIK